MTRTNYQVLLLTQCFYTLSLCITLHHNRQTSTSYKCILGLTNLLYNHPNGSLLCNAQALLNQGWKAWGDHEDPKIKQNKLLILKENWNKTKNNIVFMYSNMDLRNSLKHTLMEGSEIKLSMSCCWSLAFLRRGSSLTLLVGSMKEEREDPEVDGTDLALN